VNDINSDNSYFIWKFINMELLFRMHAK